MRSRTRWSLAAAGMVAACGSHAPNAASDAPAATDAAAAGDADANSAFAISPANVSLHGGGAQQFTIVVDGVPATIPVTWYVAGIAGGNSTLGAIDSGGDYVAPDDVPGDPYVRITAISQTTPPMHATAFALITRSASQTVGADFYVDGSNGSDSNDGSIGSPWATIGKANAAVAAGDTVHVLPGTYSEAIVTAAVNGGPSAPIRFVSEVKWGAKVRGYVPQPTCDIYSPPYCVNQTFELNGDYMMLEGFDITNANVDLVGGAGHLGIDVEGHHDSIIDNHIHDILPHGGVDNLGGAAVVSGDNATYMNVIGNWVDNIGDLTVPYYQVHGIYVSSTGGFIYNNVVYKTQGWGIQLWHAATNVVISNNTVFNNMAGGILVGDGDQPCPPNGPACVYDNNTIVTNNIAVYNFANNPSGETLGGCGIIETGDVGDPVAHTNANVYNNNLSYGNATGNLCTEESANPSSNFAANVLMPPQFVDYQADGSGDYHLLATSPAVGAGTTAGPAPSYDFEGVPRPFPGGAAPDIGAYQYNPILQ